MKRSARLLVRGGIALALAACPAIAAAQPRNFDIAAQDAIKAIPEFGRQAGLRVTAPVSGLRGVRTPAIRGTMEPDAALALLLRDTDLIVARNDGKTLILQRRPPRPSPTADNAAATVGATPGADGEIIVTGSRIERTGFDAPTPTTVIGATELRQGARASIAQILNDQPQFRPTFSPQASVGNVGAGTAPVDLRGLRPERTLVLLNGHRFAGDGNLNLIPTAMVERIEIVTGGASAAWGSGAVAGVVNLRLRDDYQGLTIGGESGISSRGDAQRHAASGLYGRTFAGGRGHVVIGVEHVHDRGVADRNSRSNLGSAGLAKVDPTVPASIDNRYELVRDVNYPDRNRGGVITSGILAGQTFEPDGSLRPFRGPDARNIGGADAIGLYDDVVVAAPFARVNGVVRASLDLGGGRLWAEGMWGRATTHGPIAPDFLIGPITVKASNPFLSEAIRTRLAAAGQAGFTLGRVFDDAYLMRFDGRRTYIEAALGIDRRLREGWRYRAYATRSALINDQRLANSRIVALYDRAIDAVRSGDRIVCAVNADAIATNDDPACQPINPFGAGNVSPEAIAYTTGTQQSRVRTTLDVAAAELQGDIATLWAGPLTLAIGAEVRWERQVSRASALDLARAFTNFNPFGDPVSGGFAVQEGFAEAAVPLIDHPGSVKLDFSGAARFSHYSRSGGIWSWKIGATARLWDGLLLRVTRSRDIRAPSITNLFGARALTVTTLVDRDPPSSSPPGYDPTPGQVRTYIGGNPALRPETSGTLTLGAVATPAFLPGFNLSVDYYDIEIKGAITSLSATNLTAACRNGNQTACAAITRDPLTGTVIEVLSIAQNINGFQTRGIDLEASYGISVSSIVGGGPATLRVRALATYVDRFVLNSVTRVDTAGDVGDSTANGLPRWRGILSLTYQDDAVGIDTRLRYVAGGSYNHLLNGIDAPQYLINNHIAARTYIDVGARARVRGGLTVYGGINNLFDVDPPISIAGPVHYDAIGRYLTVGIKLDF